MTLSEARMHARLPEPLIVVVADDDDDLRSLATAMLRAEGCSTLEARDGQELVDLLQAADEPGLRPDVVVADVMMPRLSGLGALEALRRARRDVPVVMMTGASDEAIRSVAAKLGAAEVLRKPFEPDDLVTAVRKARASPPQRPT